MLPTTSVKYLQYLYKTQNKLCNEFYIIAFIKLYSNIKSKHAAYVFFCDTNREIAFMILLYLLSWKIGVTSVKQTDEACRVLIMIDFNFLSTR